MTLRQLGHTESPKHTHDHSLRGCNRCEHAAHRAERRAAGQPGGVRPRVSHDGGRAALCQRAAARDLGLFLRDLPATVWSKALRQPKDVVDNVTDATS